MTPAQEAKEYAAANGFTIRPDRRRYIVEHSDSQYEGYVADVGGYQAALNAMKKFVESLGAFADAIIGGGHGKLYGSEQRPDETPGQFEARVLDAKTALNVNSDEARARWVLKNRDDKVIASGEVSELLAPVFIANATPKYALDPLFDNFNDESKARIRAAAAKLSAKTGPQTPRWAIFIGDKEWLRFGTRERCVKESRRLHNGNSRFACWGGGRTIRQLATWEY